MFVQTGIVETEFRRKLLRNYFDNFEQHNEQ